MSELHGIKCDACGREVVSGTRIKGDRRQAILNGFTRCAYRIDLCDDCFQRIMTECRSKAFAEDGE